MAISDINNIFLRRIVLIIALPFAIIFLSVGTIFLAVISAIKEFSADINDSYYHAIDIADTFKSTWTDKN